MIQNQQLDYATLQQQMAYASLKPSASALFRLRVDDFTVNEILSFNPSDAGEHVLLLVEKQNMDTQQVVRWLARRFNVTPSKVGYAGLKDKRAIARQWFSVHTKSQADELETDSEQLRILKSTRNNKKLRQGAIRCNQFIIKLRQVTGDKQRIDQGLQHLQQYGFPNYFTEQRFGEKGDNVSQGLALFNGTLKTSNRFKQRIYISSVRSFLFNKVLSKRVEQGTWNTPIDGDVLMLHDSHSVFAVEQITDDIRHRVSRTELHVSGPLPGSAPSMARNGALALEQEVLQQYPDLLLGLENYNQKTARRALRCMADSLRWNWLDDSTLQIEFALQSGSYATALLREIATLRRHSPD